MGCVTTVDGQGTHQLKLYSTWDYLGRGVSNWAQDRQGAWFATATSDRVRLWSRPGWQHVRDFSISPAKNRRIAFSPDSTRIAMRDNNNIEVWSVATEQRLAQTSPKITYAVDILWLDDNALATVNDREAMIFKPDLSVTQNIMFTYDSIKFAAAGGHVVFTENSTLVVASTNSSPPRRISLPKPAKVAQVSPDERTAYVAGEHFIAAVLLADDAIREMEIPKP